jgi:hypothetical protein
MPDVPFQRTKPVVLLCQLLLNVVNGRQDGFEAGGRLLLSSVTVLVPAFLAAACCPGLSSGLRHRTIVLKYRYHGPKPGPQQTRGRLGDSAWSLPQRGSSNPWRLRQEKLGPTE